MCHLGIFDVQFMCPICLKNVRIRVKAADTGEIRRVAIRHLDHVIIVSYDDRGLVRSLDAIRISHQSCDMVDRCPQCGKEICFSFPNENICEQAIVHSDHVVIIYSIRRRYFLEAIELVNEDKEEGYENIVSRICERTSIDYMAYILYKALIEEDKIIFVPKDIVDMLNDLFSKITELKRIVFLPSDTDIEYPTTTAFFKEVVKKLLKLSNQDVITRLNQTVLMLKKLVKMLAKSLREGKINMVCEVFVSINNRDLKETLLLLLREKISNQLYDVLNESCRGLEK